MKIVIPEDLKTLCEKAAFPVYVTGGYIRNQIKNLGETDIDLAGPVPAAALALPPSYKIETVNFRLGTALIRCGRKQYEYTPFRTENYPSSGAHSPHSIAFTSDIRADVKRRDFTCNSLYYDVAKDELIDLVGGMNDISDSVMRSLNPGFTFSSDGLRLLRLVRIAAETGFKIDASTANAAIKNRELLRDISPERKREELNRMLSADKKYGTANAHYRALKLTHKLKLLDFVVPSLSEGEGLEQNPLYHKYDVLEHTFMAVKFADESVRLAALFHDMGKIYCQKTFGKMHGHEKASERSALELLGQRGLKYSNSVVEETAALCALHMYDKDGKTKETKVKLFIVNNFALIDKLILLIKADRAATGMNPYPQAVRLENIKAKLIEEGAPLTLKDLEIGGTDLLDLGCRGEKLGLLLKDMHEKCVLNTALNNRDWLLSYAEKKIGQLKKA